MSKIQNIPKDAKLVFEGKIFDVFQWEQVLFDGSIKTFEKLKRADSVNVICITKNQKILLIRQQQPNTNIFWSLVGGGIENSETSIECVKRELLEETGYILDNWKLWKISSISPKIDYSIHTFICYDAININSQKLDNGEKIEVFELEYKEFEDIVLSDDFFGQDIKYAIMESKLYSEKENNLIKLIHV